MNTATDTTTGGTQASSSETTEQTAAASTAGQTTDQTASTQTGATSAADTTGAAAADTPWQDSLEGDLATNPLFRAYKTPSDLAKAHAHLTALKGATAAELLKIPSKPQDQAPDDWAPIHKALGVPDDPKDYKIELAPEAAADTPELANILRELGGKAKFTPQAMDAVIETLNDLGKKSAEAETALKAEALKLTDDTLRKEWGAAYEANKRGIGKLIRDALGGQIDEAAADDLAADLGSNMTLSRVLAHAIGKMAEPEAPEGAGREAGAGKAMTPKEATAALNAFHGDSEKMAALQNRNHPQHKAVLEERAGILAMQRGEKRPDNPG